jgi:hypothetical protein
MTESVVCEFCGLPVDPLVPGCFQWTSGWVEVRAEGGGHGVTLPQRAPRWACGVCIDLIRHGMSPGQTSLL